MRILVTGGAGFVGSRDVRTMLARGYPGYAHAEVTVLLAAVVPGHDAVLNFAAETHVGRSIKDAAQFLATSVTGVQTLLQACLDAGRVWQLRCAGTPSTGTGLRR